MNTIHSDKCIMPEHGLETAVAECCRPRMAKLNDASTLESAEGTILAFWGDRVAWKKASANTFNCLIGCSIGDFGVLIYMHAYHPQVSMWLTMGLAMAAGLMTSVLFESAVLRYKEGFSWRKAATMAFSMSFLSMLGMELAANLTDYLLTGGRVGVHQPFYWAALAISALAGFITPLPYNYWKFKKHGRTCH